MLLSSKAHFTITLLNLLYYSVCVKLIYLVVFITMFTTNSCKLKVLLGRLELSMIRRIRWIPSSQCVQLVQLMLKNRGKPLGMTKSFDGSRGNKIDKLGISSALRNSRKSQRYWCLGNQYSLAIISITWTHPSRLYCSRRLVDGIFVRQLEIAQQIY